MFLMISNMTQSKKVNNEKWVLTNSSKMKCGGVRQSTPKEEAMIEEARRRRRYRKDNKLDKL